MTSYYVWSGATGSGNGSSWANAYTGLLAAMAGKAAGDIFYVAHDHADATGGSNLSAAGSTLAVPHRVICANRAGSVPPVPADRRATAVYTNSGTINFIGYAHFDGIIFDMSSGSSGNIILGGALGNWLRFDNCSLRLTGGVSGSRIACWTNAGCLYELNNTPVWFSHVSQGFTIGNIFRWRNTPSALAGTAVPTTLFQINGVGADVECIGVDLSAAGSGKTICGALDAASANRLRLIDCKLNASVTKSAVPLTHGSTEVEFIRSGSSGVNYSVFRQRISGTLDHETTIVRSGGASDGTTPISWKIQTTANCSYSMPFECPPIAIWNDTTGSSVTATVEGIWGGGAVPNDNDIWIDVEYLGDAASPQGSFVNDGTADLLTTAAAQTSSSATWGGSTTKFKLDTSFTPQQKGWLYARVKCAKPSSTFYVDPVVTLT